MLNVYNIFTIYQKKIDSLYKDFLLNNFQPIIYNFWKFYMLKNWSLSLWF